MRRYLFGVLAAALVGVFVFPTATLGAPAAKTVVCHGEGNGAFIPIEVADKAVPAHEAHGDGFPGAPVPGDDASVFDLDCNVVPFPTSCQEWRDLDPNNGDGDYEILAGQKFTVYCHDMAGTPAEYLNLVNTGGNFNFSQWTAGGARPGTNVRTSYSKIRLDPATLLVDVSDQTFSSSAGQAGAIKSMPYGMAGDCIRSLSKTGIANVDLTGTPFKVIDPFLVDGFRPAGTIAKSSSDQVVDLTGGGFCGWTASSAIENSLPNRPVEGFRLDLAFLP